MSSSPELDKVKKEIEVTNAKIEKFSECLEKTDDPVREKILLKLLSSLTDSLAALQSKENIFLCQGQAMPLGPDKWKEVLEEFISPVRNLMHMVLLGGMEPTAPSSTRAEQEYRKIALEYYYGYDTQPDQLTCMVTGKTMPAPVIRAGHVYRRAWNGPLLNFLANMSVNDPRNIVFMRKQVEQKFDMFEITIIPQVEDDEFKVVVLNQDLLEQCIGSGSQDDSMKWGEINNQNLQLQDLQLGRRPARRVLAAHAMLAVHRAESKNWIGKGTVKVPEAGWSSPGYDPIHMKKFLDTLNMTRYVAGATE